MSHALVAASRWRPVQAGGRTLIVTCIGCQAGAPNDSNALRRAGWLETPHGHRLLLCPPCAEAHAATRRATRHAQGRPAMSTTTAGLDTRRGGGR
jgi:hypothetical protein